MPKEFFVDCVRCGWCCGYRRDSVFGGCSYASDEKISADIVVIDGDLGPTIPVDEDDICIYLSKLNNGFAICRIQDKKPRMCKLFNCLTEQKVRQLRPVIETLKEKCE